MSSKSKTKVNVQSNLASYAGTVAAYTGNDRIRMRRLDGDTVRVHVHKKAFRERSEYIAFEVDAAELRAMVRLEAGVAK